MRKLLVTFLIVMLAGTTVCPWPALAQSMDTAATLDAPVNVPGGQKKLSLAVTGENVRTVLHDLSARGGFNLIMDESVSGNVTVELSNVTINQALQAVAALSDILVVKQSGEIYLAIGRQAAQDKGISRQLSKVIKIYYSNANRIADVLNHSIFASANVANAGAQAVQKVRADSRTNSIIVVGTAREIQLAEASVSRLDVPRQSKTFYLSHANALDVATMLASSIFNDGTGSLMIGGAGGAGGGAAGGAAGGPGGAAAMAMPSSLRVEVQDVSEGSGVNNLGGGGGSGGGVTSGLSSTVTLRGFVKSSATAQVSPEGPMVIPDTRQNAVTVMGTAEQIALAESLIPTMDAQLPQVSIEASLVEISDRGIKELSNQIGISDGRLSSGFNNQALAGINPNPDLVGNASQPAGTGLIGLPTVDPSDTNSYARSGIVLSSNPLTRQKDYALRIRNLMTQNKAKLLANPTVVATHDTESIISIVNEVIRRITTQVDANGFATQTVEIGEAGIVLDILPKIGEDGTISMRLRPSVTSVLDSFSLAGGIVTLLSKRDLLTQSVRVRDGETLVLGGLIREDNTLREDKMPLLGDAPIVGAMFRASRRDGTRTELVLMITPHILNKTKVVPVNATSTSPMETSMAGGTR